MSRTVVPALRSPDGYRRQPTNHHKYSDTGPSTEATSWAGADPLSRSSAPTSKVRGQGFRTRLGGYGFGEPYARTRQRGPKVRVPRGPRAKGSFRSRSLFLAAARPGSHSLYFEPQSTRNRASIRLITDSLSRGGINRRGRGEPRSSLTTNPPLLLGSTFGVSSLAGLFCTT